MERVLDRVRQRRGAALPVPALAGMAVYGAAATSFAPFTTPQAAATGVAMAVVVALALARGWHRPGPPDDGPRLGRRAWPGLVVWAGLLGVATAVQLYHFEHWPRDVYPTLSSLAGQVFDAHPVRAAAYTLWLWLGWYVLDR
jgi:hypothetical protein